MEAAVNATELAVIWSSSDKQVARNAVFNYTLNAKCRDWWSNVYLIIWGPSAKLLAGDKELKQTVIEMKDRGIIVSACAQNAYSYGVCDDLKSLGIDLKGVQEPVSEMLRRGAKVITF